jgi:hypothetical protein
VSKRRVFGARVASFAALAWSAAWPAAAQSNDDTTTSAPTAKGPADAATQASSTEVTGKELFDAAKQLYDEGRYEDACRTFEESAKVRRGIGVQYQLANCWERIGRTASAHALFLEVAEATRWQGQYDRERLARQRAQALESRLSYLQIVVRAPEPGLELKRDGLPIAPPRWAAPIALDAGDHEIHAVAPGKRPHRARVTVHPGEAGTVVLEIPPLAAAGSVATSSAPQKAEVRRATPAEAAERRPDTTRKNLTIALAGVGAATMLTGTAFAIQAIGNHRDAEAICRAGHCTAEQISLRTPLDDDTRSARTLAIASVGAGVGALLGAGYLYLTAPPQQSSQVGKVSLQPLASPSEGVFGAVVSGSL